MEKIKRKKSLSVVPAPTGSVKLKGKDLDLIASQWKSFHSSLRLLDEIRIEKFEPAAIFLWNR